MKVALGAAKGLAFLHSSETRVIYRDFKTSNILLDSVILNFSFFDMISNERSVKVSSFMLKLSRA